MVAGLQREPGGQKASGRRLAIAGELARACLRGNGRGTAS